MAHFRCARVWAGTAGACEQRCPVGEAAIIAVLHRGSLYQALTPRWASYPSGPLTGRFQTSPVMRSSSASSNKQPTGSRWVRSVDQRIPMRILGHAQLSTTSRYHVPPQVMTDAAGR